MSGSCAWCHRRRPQETVTIDGTDFNVCPNCYYLIEAHKLAKARAQKEKRDA